MSRAQFDAETQRFRRELVAYCYRIVGAASDSEDLVQETYLRAWRYRAGFDGRASMRSWLYKIATNVCLTWLEHRKPRVLPSSLGAADAEPEPAATPAAPGEVSWLEPLPDELLTSAEAGPDAAVVARESLRLALIASLQFLPARQRAIFILREVLEFSADETAEILAASSVAVKSGLQRARARLEELAPAREELLEPTDPRARELLEGYIAAFERSDPALLVQVLRADATLEATPFREWQTGRARCIRLLEAQVLGNPGDWRMLATTANGQPAAAVYQREMDGILRARGIVALAVTPSGVSRVVAFHHEPALVRAFGFGLALGEAST
ncbi:MAG: sigma-70 family RNA polymerase sigma factor [Myxococcales bacterium]|nr:MAG: sigma-70 family RNA polymerase sigma factor [Myxococcales bacterium]